MRNFRTIYCFVLAAAFSLVIADSAQAIKILMHGRAIDPYDPADPFASQMGEDRFVLTYLRTVYGHSNVDYMRGEFASPDGSTAAGYDLIYLSSSMNTAIIRGKYEDSTVGVVNSESNTDRDNDLGNFMLSDDSGDYGANAMNPALIRHKIEILDPLHPLAGGLSGIVDVFRDPPQFTSSQYGLGALGGGVSLVAQLVTDAGTVPESAPGVPRPEWAIYAADVGGALRGDGVSSSTDPVTGVVNTSPATAAGRRAHWFQSDFGFVDLTPDGLTLFKAAIDWGASNASPPGPGDYTQDNIDDAADYVAWRKGIYSLDSTPTIIEAAYDHFKINFGSVYSGLGDSDGVPEPSSIGLLLACLGVLAGRRHR